MSNEIDLARGWLVKAASDIRAARLVLEGDGPYDTACFHAQQAIEKALKGFLALQRQPIPRTHDLDELQVACLALGPLPQLAALDLTEVTDYGVLFVQPSVKGSDGTPAAWGWAGYSWPGYKAAPVHLIILPHP